jgi:hypothetical protein
MKNTIMLIVTGLLAIAAVGAVMSSPGWEEREEDGRYEEEHGSDDPEPGFFNGGWLESRADVYPVDHELYRSECGGCHFTYQPGLLPRHDWERVMDALAEHYGDDASLDEQTAAEIRRYLLANAADRADQSRARAFSSGSDAGDVLPRITNTDYFRREHYEIPARLVRGNREVGSFSNCQACHRNADTGIYNEHQVIIPGVGKWDD